MPLIAPEHFYLIELKGNLVGAVGIELKASLILRKLLILQSAKMAKRHKSAGVRYM